MYDTPCSKSYDEVGTFNSWNKQSDATNDAVEIFVTRRRAWPFDTLLSFTHLSKSDMFKPAFSFWAIPLKVESETFMRSSGLVISGIRSDRMTIEWRKDPFIKMYKVQVTPQPAKMTQFETKVVMLLYYCWLLSNVPFQCTELLYPLRCDYCLGCKI